MRAVLPRGVRGTLRNYRILSVLHGQYKSIQQERCIDRNGLPIPWYTYPAIEYIKQLDCSDKTIFEYGSGNSTLFWAARCRRIVSTEDNPTWYEKIKAQLPANADYQLIEDKTGYAQSIHQHSEAFDIIVVDGTHRFACAVEALKKLKEDGFIILDNSDWMEKTSKLLRDADLIEVDMSGFGPVNGYTWTTSFFFSRKVQLKPGGEQQPLHGIGSLPHSEDTIKF